MIFFVSLSFYLLNYVKIIIYLEIRKESKDMNLIAIIYCMTKYVTYVNSNKKLINFFNIILNHRRRKLHLKKLFPFISTREIIFL